MTRALDGDSQLALMTRTGSHHPAGHNLRALGNIPAQLGNVLIINFLHLVHAEGTDLAAGLAAAGAGISFSLFSLCQWKNLLYSILGRLERQVFVAGDFLEIINPAALISYILLLCGRGRGVESAAIAAA